MLNNLLMGEDLESVLKGDPLESNLLKKTRKLTKRTYLGLGYVHTFKNDTTDEIVNVPCTEAEYNAMLGAVGSANNPTLAGHTWLYSTGGTDKVDTPTGMLGEDEYCIRDTEIVVNLKDKVGIEKVQLLPLVSVGVDDELDESFL